MKRTLPPELPDDMDPDEALEVLSRPWEYNFRMNLAKVREAQGVSQTGLAKLLKSEGLPFHPQTVQRVEEGKRAIRLNEAFVISKVLDVDVDTLLMPANTRPAEATVSFDAPRAARALTQMVEDWEDGLAASCDRILSVIAASGEDITEAIRGETAPAARVLWMWAVAVRLLDGLDYALDAYQHLGELFDDSPTPWRLPKGDRLERLGEALFGEDWEASVRELLENILREDHRCLAGVDESQHPFKVARSGVPVAALLGRRPE